MIVCSRSDACAPQNIIYFPVDKFFYGARAMYANDGNSVSFVSHFIARTTTAYVSEEEKNKTSILVKSSRQLYIEFLSNA